MQKEAAVFRREAASVLHNDMTGKAEAGYESS